MKKDREVMALQAEIERLKNIHNTTLGAYREEQEYSHKLKQELAQWTVRVLQLEAAAKLALEHCAFPVGAMKAKTALEAALAEKEKKRKLSLDTESGDVKLQPMYKVGYRAGVEQGKAEREKLIGALVKAAMPLEALNMSVAWELSDCVKREIIKAVREIRAVLAEAKGEKG